ncbi:MAG: MFS transporter [Desulfobacteraceae bacterium]
MIGNSGKQFIGLSSFEMLAMFRRGLFYAYLTIYLRHYLGLSVTSTTLFATLPMVVNILSQNLIWGRISDHFQIRRSLIIAGEALASLGTVGVWYLHRLPGDPFTAGYFIIFGLTAVELFWSMSNIAWSALISDLYRASERGAIQGRLTSMGGLGRIAGIWMGGLLYDGLGLQYAGWGFYQGPLFFLAAGVMLFSVLPLFLLPEGGELTSSHGSKRSSDASDRASVQALHIYLIFLAGMTFINFGRNSIAIVFPQYLASTAGLSLNSRIVGYILNTQSVAVVILGCLVGWLCRNMGRERTLLAGTVAAITGLTVLWLDTALPAIYLASFLRGVADAVIMASAYETASIYIPAALRARRFAWFNATFFLSWGLPGTLIIGPLVDFLIASGMTEPGAYRLSFGAAAGITAVGLMIQATLFFKKKKAVGLSV